MDLNNILNISKMRENVKMRIGDRDRGWTEEIGDRYRYETGVKRNFTLSLSLSLSRDSSRQSARVIDYRIFFSTSR